MDNKFCEFCSIFQDCLKLWIHKKTIENDDLSKPLLEEGLKGQILRFGEHNIAHLRKSLHEGVEESIKLTAEEKGTLD